MATSEQPLVTVGVPTYNRAAQLERTIASVLAQSYRNFELVVSDNGSTDGTEAFCRRVAAAEARIRYVRHPANRGPEFNFRHVLTEARGTLFMWLADDDWLDPNYLERCAEVLVSSPGHTVVCGRDRYFRDGVFDSDGRVFDLEQESGPDRVVSYYRQVTLNGAFYGLMRRDLVAQVPTVNEMGGDWLIVAAMAFLGKLRTLSDTCVNRSMGGQSEDWAKLARSFGLSQVESENPYLTIATTVFSDVAWRSPIYAPLGAVGRLGLAARAAATVVGRQHSLRHPLSLAWRLSRVLQARAF